MATFTFFEDGDTVDSIDRVFTSAWTGGQNNLGDIVGPAGDNTYVFHSSSTQYDTSSPTSSGAFFMEIYDTDTVSTQEVQFSIAYGHRNGSGSLDFTNQAGSIGFSAAKSIYNQYKNLVYGGDETQNFTFDGHTPDHIYVINVNRARYKNALRMGNLELLYQVLVLTIKLYFLLMIQ